MKKLLMLLLALALLAFAVGCPKPPPQVIQTPPTGGTIQTPPEVPPSVVTPETLPPSTVKGDLAGSAGERGGEKPKPGG